MRKSKKGFTLVELLVVIAILAILATVSVIGYTSFIEKANLSNDQTTIEMINENLAAASAAKKPATAGEAIGMLFKLGIYGEKLTAYSNGYKYVYNLAENKFYLVDNTGAVVYPEAADKANLWALYTDEPSDKIAGFTNYVATGSVDNATALSAVFGDNASYKFDLQKSGFLQGTVGSNVTIVQGIVPAGSSVNTEGDGVKKMNATTATVNNAKYENEVVSFEKDANQSLIVPENATFKDCVVTLDSNAAVKTKGVVFENCTFVGSVKWAIEIQGDATVKNCTFINCVRGINIVKYTGDVVIEGNVFNLVTNDPKANCIQFGEDGSTLFTDDFSLTVKNNTFASANAVVVVHEGCAKEGSLINVNSLKNKVTFSGNTFGELTNGKVVKDPDYNGTGLDALVNFFNGIIK